MLNTEILELESEIFGPISQLNVSDEEKMECLNENVSKYENKKYQSFGNIQNQSKTSLEVNKILHKNSSINFIFCGQFLEKNTLISNEATSE